MLRAAEPTTVQLLATRYLANFLQGFLEFWRQILLIRPYGKGAGKILVNLLAQVPMRT